MSKVTRGLTGILAVVLIASSAQAGTVLMPGGWQASWDDSLDPYVSINPMQVVGDALFIQKSAEFTQGSVNGIFPSIIVVFQQVSPEAVSHIVIDDEIITNSTGEDWTDFHMDLLDGGDVQFNPELTGGGQGPIGFTISPFQQAAFTPDKLRLDIWDGLVPDGGLWFPGSGVTDGQLWIDVNLTPDRATQFILKETPIPEPATMSLLALGGLAVLRKRRG